jgi:GTP-binding protein LepA
MQWATAPTRALLFDSWYDTHRGVVCLVVVQDGELHKDDVVNTFHEAGGPYEITDLGLLTPDPRADLTSDVLRTGQVGYIIAGIKSTAEVRLGDTFFALPREVLAQTGPQKGKIITQYPDQKRLGLTEVKRLLGVAKSTIDPLPGFRPAKSMVYAGLFAASDSDFTELTNAINKLILNDASVTVVKENSGALGSGFRCGFLGMLHMDVFVSRLEQEFGTSVITTAPTVPYVAYMNDGSVKNVDSPAHFPPPELTDYIEEPMVRVSIITPHDYVGALTQLCGGNRGEVEDVKFISADRALMRYKMPLAEVVQDFYQEIKSISSGYASLDYEPTRDEVSDVVKLDIRINGESVDALSTICHRSKAEDVGKKMIAKLKDSLDRQNFEIIIQCAIGGKILGRERLAPYRKDVLNKSGKTVGNGDVSRKKKLLEKQKEGKKRMKAQMGSKVEVAQDVVRGLLENRR